jgi:hypothetical protein
MGPGGPAWKFSSMVHLSPGNFDQGGQRDLVLAVVGQFPGGPVPADQKVPAAGSGVADGGPGPVVPAQPLCALAGRQPLPSPATGRAAPRRVRLEMPERTLRYDGEAKDG